MSKHFYQYPAVVVTSSEVATAPDGGSLPGLVKVVAGYDGSNVQVLRTNSSGELITSQGSKDFIERSFNDYGVTPVTSATWVQLIASTTADISELEIFDSSGQVLEIGVGPALSEVSKNYIIPGGNGRITVDIPAGSRVAIKAVTATANVGLSVINYYG